VHWEEAQFVLVILSVICIYIPKVDTVVWSVGTATRFCQSDATWDLPDVLQCERVVFMELRAIVSVIYRFLLVV